MLALLIAGCREPGASECTDGPGTSESETTFETGSVVQTADSGTAIPAWVMLDGGNDVSCGLTTDGRLYCWGEDEYLDHPTGPFVSFDHGNWGGCGVTPTGQIQCWCHNPNEEGPCRNVPLRGGVERVTRASTWACAEHRREGLRCWGAPVYARDAPTDPGLDWDIEENFGCVVQADESIACWGDLDVLALGGPDSALGPPAAVKFRKVSVGRDHACALDIDGEAHCWGSTQVETPWPYPNGTPGPWADLVSSNAFTCGIRADGSAECWHDSLRGVLDDWQLPDERWAQIGLGEWTGCGLTLDGRGVCFDEEYGNSGEFDVPDLATLPR